MCERTFYIPKSCRQLCCSKRCGDKKKTTSAVVNCGRCGKRILVRPSRAASLRKGTPACSRRCAGFLRRRPGYSAPGACRTCGRKSPAVTFRRYCGRKTFRLDCQECEQQEKIRRQRKAVQSRDRLERFIVWGSRQADRRVGRDNDLTTDFVRELISRPCSYCGDTNTRMTLDRLDNSLGHTQFNVVESCVRCNYIRRDMPHKAWLFMIEGVRAARVSGAFGDWYGSVVKHGAKL